MRGELTMENTLYIFQKGFNFSQDGPGNRLVYHLSGCNLKCPWCSNPEGLKITENSQKLNIDDIVKEALSCKMMFIEGGGVTLTGGEVTCQKEAVANLLKKLKENGIHTCIETNASLKGCEDIFSSVDYMIADFKSPNGETLKKYTGADIETVKSNLLYRAETQKPLLVRVPLISFFNKGEENAVSFAKFFKYLQDESKSDNLFFEILTYHEFGKEKYTKLGMEYAVNDGFVTDEDIKILAREIKNANLKLINT